MALAKIEMHTLQWYEKHQATIRADLYQNLADALHNGHPTAGHRVVLPSSFKGGARDMPYKLEPIELRAPQKRVEDVAVGDAKRRASNAEVQHAEAREAREAQAREAEAAAAAQLKADDARFLAAQQRWQAEPEAAAGREAGDGGLGLVGQQ